MFAFEKHLATRHELVSGENFLRKPARLLENKMCQGFFFGMFMYEEVDKIFPYFSISPIDGVWMVPKTNRGRCEKKTVCHEDRQA